MNTKRSKINAPNLSSLQQWSPQQQTLALWACMLLFSAIKMRGYWAHGRFWAEEGRYFYTDIAAMPGYSGLGYLFNHHLEWVTNFAVWCSTQVELAYAPLISTYLSWLFQMLPIGLVMHFRSQLHLNFGRTLLFLIAVAGLPQSAEVWANSINLHFHFALLAGILAVLEPQTRQQQWLFRILLLLAGISGIPPNALLPVFLGVAFMRKSREKWLQVGILGMTNLLQLGLLAAHDFAMENRDSTTQPMIVWLAIVAQHLITPILSAKLGKNVAPQLHDLLDGLHAGGLLIALVATMIYGFIWLRFIRQRRESSLIFLGAALLLAVFCVLTSLGNRSDLVTMRTGGRYFYASNLMLLLALLPHFSLPPTRFVRIALVIWALLTLANVKSYLPGMPWPEALEQAKANHTTNVTTWPRKWSLRIPEPLP